MEYIQEKFKNAALSDSRFFFDEKDLIADNLNKNPKTNELKKGIKIFQGFLAIIKTDENNTIANFVPCKYEETGTDLVKLTGP